MRRFDIAIVGGGFSGLATLANLVRGAAAPMAIALVSRDDPRAFGPAYSTTRPEHLLNVRAQAMGLFADRHRGFYEWASARDPAVTPNDYLPRMLYHDYLSSVLDETCDLAREKSISLEFIRAEVEDVREDRNALRLITGGGEIAAGQVVLAIGNALKSSASAKDDGRLVGNPWAYDFNAPENLRFRRVALIGSGLTALDTLVSIFRAGWTAEITCFSGSGLLPMAHPDEYDSAQVFSYPAEDLRGKRLSHILHRLRTAARTHPWQYAVDSLRPLIQDIWKSLLPEDRLRLAEKYFTLWNVRRHRCAAHIRAQADASISSGGLKMVRARCAAARAASDGVTLDLRHAGGRAETAQFDLAFRCTGVNYAVANNPLLSRLLESGMLNDAGNPYGVSADGEYRGYQGTGGSIYLIGTPLFGQLFETTAVPELREQAAAVAASLLGRQA